MYILRTKSFYIHDPLEKHASACWLFTWSHRSPCVGKYGMEDPSQVFWRGDGVPMNIPEAGNKQALVTQG